jgi:gamma-glutamylcyclotransferase (GGCT)/AIG2-like uncharacterized protein YtfP
MHVFTYGTLMFPEVWQAVVGRSFRAVAGCAAGFTVWRVRGAVYPGIAAAVASSADGLVYLDVDDATVARLDRFEDDFYVRQPIRVRCDDGIERLAECYVVPKERLTVLDDEPWTSADFEARGDLARFIAGFAGFERAATQKG